jgi:acetyl-CoA synthetase
VFSGFSAEALANRLLDSEAKILISADAVLRGNKPVLLKQAADEALTLCAKTGLQVKLFLLRTESPCVECTY